MHKFRLAVLTAFFLLFTFYFLLFSPQAFAQTNGISVTPSIIKLDLQEDKPEFILYYKNTTSEPLQLKFRAQDFTELEDGWKVKFLEDKDAKNYSYSLTSWLEFERKTLDLNPGEERQLKVRLNKDTLTPGGHYASVLAEISQPEDKKQTLSVRGILSSIVFVRTNTGREVESAEISSFGASKANFLSIPKEFVFRLHNTGNTDLTPFGTIEIRNNFNQLVAKGIINDGSLITLPETIRRYDVQVKNTQSNFWPGLYKAKLTINYGKNNQQTLKKDLLIPVAGNRLIQIALLFILVAFIALIFYLIKKNRIKKIKKKQEEQESVEKKAEVIPTGYTKAKRRRKGKAS